MDKLSKKQRSENMSKIKAKNTIPEIVVRKYLYSKGLRYRIHQKKLPGNPDVVFYSRKKIIKVNGCFWHSHNCKASSYIPKTNSSFWKNKLLDNKTRDKFNDRKLLEDYWEILTIWECQIKTKKYIDLIDNFI